MSDLLGEAGRAALKTFAVALVAIAPGAWVAPNLDGTIAVGIAALMAFVAAAAAGVQTIWPALAVRAHVAGLTGALLDSFVHAFLGAFIVAITGWLAMPNYETWKSILLGAFAGALNAGMRAIQGAFTPGENPVPAKGVRLRRSTAPRPVLLPA